MTHPNVEDHFDGVLSLGPPAALQMAPLSYPRCAAPDYIALRVGRTVATGMAATVSERLARDCAAAKPQ